ncbi:TPA: hypothetical protein ACMD15_003409 [Vibrio cholerae]
MLKVNAILAVGSMITNILEKLGFFSDKKVDYKKLFVTIGLILSTTILTTCSDVTLEQLKKHFDFAQDVVESSEVKQ